MRCLNFSSLYFSCCFSSQFQEIAVDTAQAMLVLVGLNHVSPLSAFLGRFMQFSLSL